MSKMYEKREQLRQKGFTLVEIMVVIAILAIIAAIAIPVYSNYVKDAKFAQAKSNLVLLSTLMERYYQNHNVYYATTTDLQPYTVATPTLRGWDPGNSSNPLFTYNIVNPDSGMPPAACNAGAIPSPSYLLSAIPTATSGLPTGDVLYLDSANNRCEAQANGTVVVGW